MAELELRPLGPDEMAVLYRREVRNTFPPSERKSLGAIQRQMRAGNYPVWGLFQGNYLVGYALLWLAEGGQAALLDYLGVTEACRGRGYGSLLLERLFQIYGAHTAILAEVEAPEAREPRERALQERRLKFYHRAGFRYTGFDSLLFGVHYRLLAAGPGERESLLTAYRSLYQGHLSQMLYHKFVQIPWENGQIPGKGESTHEYFSH